jgi:phosphoribosylaminoimidazolecarboxamide formyltransferase/IMP cyclohydrolase
MSTSSTRDRLALAEPGEVQITRALLSVSDKTGIVEFARGLADLGIEVVSTGGTATAIAAAGVPVRSISDLTRFPEIMDGRVKTLNPRLYASLLAVRSNPEHVSAALEHDVEPVDLVAVNLYPFERTAAVRGVADAEVIENIDIGGPTMIRAAAKNFAFSAPVTSPAAYDAILEELRATDRRLSLDTRRTLATEAFAYTARYDAAITRWFQERENATFPPQIIRAFEKSLDLPHGENPHQRAAYYSQLGSRTHLLSMVAQRGGSALSHANLRDLDTARTLLEEFSAPVCVAVSEDLPCAVATATTLADAYATVRSAAPPPGGVLAFNGHVDAELAVALDLDGVELIFAHGYDDSALERLLAVAGLRVLENQERRVPGLHLEVATRQVRGGLLVQDRDVEMETPDVMHVVSQRRPTEAEWATLSFAWTVAKHVRSHAIVIATAGATLAIGAGQASQADAAALALAAVASGEDGSPQVPCGAVVAADAPIGGLDALAPLLAAGCAAIIQPGGVDADLGMVEEVDRAGAVMVFTGRRHLRH